jgi:hypothetical protein
MQEVICRGADDRALDARDQRVGERRLARAVDAVDRDDPAAAGRQARDGPCREPEGVVVRERGRRYSVSGCIAPW